MKDPLRHVSVRYKLPLMFISVCLLAFGAGGYLVSGSARRALEEEILSRLDFQSRVYATALEGRIQTLARRTEDFASDGYIRELTRELVREEGTPAELQMKEELRAHLVGNKLPLEPSFADLYIVKPSGEVLLAANESSPTSAPGAVDSDSPDSPTYFSDLIPSEGAPRFFISTPLYSPKGGRCLGRLVCWVRSRVWIVSALSGGGLDLDRAEDSVRLQIVDGSRQRLIIDSELPLSTSDMPLVVEEQARELDGSPRHSGLVLFARSHPIESSGWQLQVDLIPDNAFAPIGGLQNRILGVGLTLGLLASLLLFFPMRFLARPLLRLTEAARRLRDGDYSSRVSIESSDELGELSESFNSMMDAVQERTERLQQTTADLRDRQSELSYERDRMRAVIASMRDGLVVLDGSGEPLFHNGPAAPLLRQILDAKNELVSHHICTTRESEELDCRACLFDPAGVPRSCVLEIDGGVYEVHTTLLGPDRTGMAGRVLVSRDLSDRITQDEQQIHQERLVVLGEVAAVMAHELNNPLAAINMYNQMTIAEVETESDIAENSQVIARNVQTCKRTIRELLDYATDATPEIGSVDIGATLEDASIFLRPIRERSSVKLSMDVPEGLPGVTGDAIIGSSWQEIRRNPKNP